MAAAAWLCRKTGTEPVIDSIVAAVVNADDASTEAVVIAEAVATGVGAGHKLYAGYFSSADLVLASGQLDADEDAVFFGPVKSEVIA